MNMTISYPASLGSRVTAVWDGIHPALRGRRGLISAGLIAGIGLLAGWRWFGTTTVLPLLYALPCAAMMVMCMKGHGSSATEKVGDPGASSGKPDPGSPR
jgi:hypothetical protein